MHRALMLACIVAAFLSLYNMRFTLRDDANTVAAAAAEKSAYPTHHPWAHLRVPFYIHTGDGFDVFETHCAKPFWPKGVEVSWMTHIRTHPWRVFNPSAASLFVIPALFGVAFLDKNKMCNASVSVMSHALAQSLENNVWFHRHNGTDHVLVTTYFKAEVYLTNHARWFRLLRNAIVVHHVISPHFYQRTKTAPLVPSSKQLGRCQIAVGQQVCDVCVLEYARTTRRDKKNIYI